MGLKYANNAKTTLNGAHNSSTTTITVVDGSVFPALGAGDYFYMTLEDVSLNNEIVKVTARSTNTLTVVRAQNGTTAKSFSTADKAEGRMVTGILDDIRALVGDVIPSAFFLTLVDDTTAGDALTTLGLSSAVQTFLAAPSSANLRALMSDESGSGALLFAGGALGTPTSGLLTNCTGLPNTSVVGLGTAAVVNTGTSGATIPLLNGANTWSAAQIMTAALDMRNDVKFTDAGTNRWAVGRGAGGGGAADDWQIYNYSGGVPLRIPYATNIAAFLNTPTVAGDPVMTRGSVETITATKTFRRTGGNFQFLIDNGANTKQMGSWFSASDDQWNLQPCSAGSLVSGKALSYNFTDGLWSLYGSPVMTRGAAETVTGAKTFMGQVNIGDGTGARSLNMNAAASQANFIQILEAGTQKWLFGRNVIDGTGKFDIWHAGVGTALRIDPSSLRADFTAVSVGGKEVLSHAGAYNSGRVTYSTSEPSGGNDGDIWFQYV